MPQVFTKALLSGSTNGRGIKVVQTGTAGTTIHTAVNSTSAIDEIYLYAYNSHTADVTLTLEWGGTTVPEDNTVINIPKGGRYLIVDGRLLNNNLIVKAFASVANVIVIDGFVNQIV